MHKVQKAFKKIKADKKGSLLWEFLLVIAVFFVILWSVISFVGVYVQFEGLSYAAKTAARQIEVTGRCDEEFILQNITNLTGNSNLYDVTFEFHADPNYPEKDPSLAQRLEQAKKLQLRQSFTLTVSAKHKFQILGAGSLDGMFEFEVPMHYSVTGMSEVYWREGDIAGGGR